MAVSMLVKSNKTMQKGFCCYFSVTKHEAQLAICTCLLLFAQQSGSLRSHATTASTRTETLSSIDWLSHLQV